MCADFLDQLLFFFIIFITDLTDDFFQKILHRDQTGAGAILIQHNSNGIAAFTHFIEKLICLFCFKCIIGFAHDGTKRKIRSAVTEEILQSHDTDDIIFLPFINRDTGKHCFLKDRLQTSVAGLHIHHRHIDTWDHDITCQGIIQIKYIQYHFSLIRFDHTLFMADIHICLQLCLRHTGACFGCIDPEKLHQKLGQLIYKKYNRCQKPDQL